MVRVFLSQRRRENGSFLGLLSSQVAGRGTAFARRFAAALVL